MSELTEKHCAPCEGIGQAMTKDEAEAMLKQIPGWQLNEAGTMIYRDFSFKGFTKTMFFVNAIAYIAQQEMHHPDLEIGFNYCNARFTTHALDGLSENDFICAAKINALL